MTASGGSGFARMVEKDKVKIAPQFFQLIKCPFSPHKPPTKKSR
jgi:hypothetical protein